MTITLSQQLYQFLVAAIIGAALGVVYDFFRVLRLVGFKATVVVFIEDVAFFLIATLTMFSYYMQITDGKFRIIFLVAAIVGFVLYNMTIGRLIFFVIKKIYDFISRVFRLVFEKIISPLFKKIIVKPMKAIGKFFKEKIYNFFKKVLPTKHKMLYNTRRIYKRRGGKRKNGTSFW